MVTQNQIDSFHQFASKQLTGDGSDRSIDELARCSSWLAAFPRPTPPVIQFHYYSPESKVLRSHLTSHQRSCPHFLLRSSRAAAGDFFQQAEGISRFSRLTFPVSQWDRIYLCSFARCNFAGACPDSTEHRVDFSRRISPRRSGSIC